MTYSAPVAIRFDPPYKRLTVTERSLCDTVVNAIARTAHLNQQRISAVLDREWQIPAGLLDDEAREILARPLVTAAVRDRITEMAAERELTVHWWQTELMAVARASMANYFTMVEDLDGTMQPALDLSNCTPEQWSAIKTLEIETPNSGGFERSSGKIKIKITLWDKMAALDRLGRFIGAADSSNPYWNSTGPGETQRPMAPGAATSAEDMGEAYARMLESGG